MRFRFKPNPDQRSVLRAQLARLQQPAAVVQTIGSILPAGFTPIEVVCSPQSVHPDRFVLRAQLRSHTGQEHGYALKVYSDDFGQRVWAHAQALAKSLSGCRDRPRPRNQSSSVFDYEDEDEKEDDGAAPEPVFQMGGGHNPPDADGLCLPIACLPRQRMLVFHWVEGVFLSEIVDERKSGLLQQAARIVADLHRSRIVPERPTSAQMLVDETRALCDRQRRLWPQAAEMVDPLLDALLEAVSSLDPAEPAPVHGDLGTRQFLWTGNRLLLLDLDMFGYTDPAYDAGHFLAQLERLVLVDPTVRAHAPEWLAAFGDAYLAAMPHVSPRNVWFYRALTLVRKIYTICRRERLKWPRLVPQLAEHAWAALQQVASPALIQSCEA